MITNEKTEQFIENRKDSWKESNVPYADGLTLHNLIVKNDYKSALEIGTSSGHASIWMAWALSKTGGKLVTIELDEARHNAAKANFDEAGVSGIIDARLGDAHELVKKVRGPFDFIFSDADKEWYTQYFIDVEKKLSVGGCFAAHNVTSGFADVDEFVKYVRKLDNYKTTIDKKSDAGISISYKKSK